MKTILLAISLALLTSAKAQVSFTIEGGYNNRNCPQMGAYLQYNVGHLFVAGGLSGLIGKKTDQGALFYSRIGYSITLSENYLLEPAIGYGNEYNSSEDKSLNKSGGVASLHLVRQLSNPNGSLIGGITATKSLVLVNVGIRFSFIRGSGKSGCPASW
jgi:hypothetical protein